MEDVYELGAPDASGAVGRRERASECEPVAETSVLVPADWAVNGVGDELGVLGRVYWRGLGSLERGLGVEEAMFARGYLGRLAVTRDTSVGYGRLRGEETGGDSQE